MLRSRNGVLNNSK